MRLREPSQFAPAPPFYELAELASAATTGTDRSATTGQATLPRTGSYIVEVASEGFLRWRAQRAHGGV